MKRIDRETVQRILDTADIVEVVSDFVNLKKRGANYIGLCPFHNERTPSFSVSRTKGICKCFSCGKGGSPVNFIMEHEQLSFNEALRYLARKYHIEIKEHEMTDAEREEATEREALMAVNDFALGVFSRNLTDTQDGRDIGLSYFRERGINDQMIERFKLGYSLDSSDALYKAAIAAGFDEKHLLATGLCARSNRDNSIYDRFRGRVIYPVFSVSGRVVAFGGRTLRSDKNVAKYVNSPESAIYHKSRELYGLYQAKQAIVKNNKCILVEGYMDVISMHQSGIENVVASSGTSLTEGQIRLIHRFTENVTVIYDSDAAGIKASLRGIDLLLAEGLNIKVLLLPDGEDPDSFAQSHSSSEVIAYIDEHETDFLRFKTSILLSDAKDDPIARARVTNDIIRSIAVIPDAVLRSEYIRECSRMLQIDERVLVLQLQKVMADNAARPRRPDNAEPDKQQPDVPAQEAVQLPPRHVRDDAAQAAVSSMVSQCERELLRYIVKYGMTTLTEVDSMPVSVLEFVRMELEDDGILFSTPLYALIYAKALDIMRETWADADAAFRERIGTEYAEQMRLGEEEIRQQATDLADIEVREKLLREKCDEAYFSKLDDFSAKYIEMALVSDPDDGVRRVATDLVAEKHTLSKVHTHYARVATERERLSELVPRAVAELKLGIINDRIAKNQTLLKTLTDDAELTRLILAQKELFELRATLAKYLGERIVVPPHH